MLAFAATPMLRLIKPIFLPRFEPVPHGAVNDTVDHAEDRYTTVLLGFNGLAFGKHWKWDVKVGVGKGAQLSRQVLDFCPVFPCFPREEFERLSCPAIDASCGIFHPFQLLDELFRGVREVIILSLGNILRVIAFEVFPHVRVLRMSAVDLGPCFNKLLMDVFRFCDVFAFLRRVREIRGGRGIVTLCSAKSSSPIVFFPVPFIHGFTGILSFTDEPPVDLIPFLVTDPYQSI